MTGSLTEIVFLILAGVLGGAVNAAAGGAKLFVFPLLLATGLSALAANVTATVALWPAQAMAAVPYRRELARAWPELLRRLLPAGAGALCGALVLLLGGEDAFVTVIPFVLAIAVAAIVAGKGGAAALRRLVPEGRLGAVAGVLFFACGFYGGYFGAGMGFMLLAVLMVAGLGVMQEANAQKVLLAFVINSVAVIPIAFSGLVDWLAAFWVLFGGLFGGYVGAHLTRRIPDRPLRIGIAAIGVVLTLSFLTG